MIFGHVRDNFPRVTLTLPGRNGRLNVEFIIDTGFEGELALPGSVIVQLDVSEPFSRRIRLADGSVREQPHFKIVMDWYEEPRLTEIALLEGNPLLGVELMA